MSENVYFRKVFLSLISISFLVLLILNENLKILTATLLTILVFITAIFYTYRTSELISMRNADANIYAYIRLAENSNDKSRREYQSMVKLWLCHSNRANNLQKLNTAYTVFWLNSVIFMFFAFLIAMTSYEKYAWIFIFMALLMIILFSSFAHQNTLFWGNNWQEKINKINIPYRFKSSFLDCTLSHDKGFEDYLSRFNWIEKKWLKCKNPEDVWLDP